MRLAVKDANVLIDLVEAALLDLWGVMALEVHVTDLVLAEIRDDKQRGDVDAYVAKFGVTVHELDEGATAECMRMAEQHGMSLADASALRLAKELDAILLSGDSLLRKTATRDKVEVRGLLWIFDELVKRRALAMAAAAKRLRQVMAAGSFLPPRECIERLERWERTEK